MRTLILTALLILLLTGSISCGEIPVDKVQAHIEKHWAGIDMTGIWIAGHYAPDNEHMLGPGLFQNNQARIEFCWGSFVDGLETEGFFGPYTANTF